MSKDFGANGLRIRAIISRSNNDLHTALKTMCLYSFASGISDHATGTLHQDAAFTGKYIAPNQELLIDAHAL
jgi:hypothetical protein